VLSPAARFASGDRLELHGDVSMSGASADMSGQTAARLSAANRNVWWTGGGSIRKHNDLRAGRGEDSHNVFRRFFALDDDAINALLGNRMQDTAFRQSGYFSKLAFKPDDTQSLTFWYQGSRQNGVRGYKDLLGGRGRLQSRFDPQLLHFLYSRYEKISAGFLAFVSLQFPQS
jgi:hypothetical protein